MTEEQIPVRSIQHWLYCRHRWGLLEIDCAWAENYYVTKANLLHKIVSYDVATSEPEGKKRLRKVAKECQNHAQRVQNSVFEADLDYSAFLKLKSRLTELIDRDKDSLRFYYLGNNWERRVEHIGAKQTYNPEGVIIL